MTVISIFSIYAGNTAIAGMYALANEREKFFPFIGLS